MIGWMPLFKIKDYTTSARVRLLVRRGVGPKKKGYGQGQDYDQSQGQGIRLFWYNFRPNASSDQSSFGPIGLPFTMLNYSTNHTATPVPQTNKDTWQQSDIQTRTYQRHVNWQMKVFNIHVQYNINIDVIQIRVCTYLI